MYGRFTGFEAGASSHDPSRLFAVHRILTGVQYRDEILVLVNCSVNKRQQKIYVIPTCLR